MAEFDIDVTELENAATRLRQISGAGARAYAGIVQKYGHFTRRQAIQNAPYDASNTTRKHLRDSFETIENDTSGRFTSSEWTVTAPHASPVEYGFHHYRNGFIGPQPYVRPALKKYRRPMIEELATAAKAQFKTLKSVSRPQLGSVPTLANRPDTPRR